MRSSGSQKKTIIYHPGSILRKSKDMDHSINNGVVNNDDNDKLFMSRDKFDKGRRSPTDDDSVKIKTDREDNNSFD